MTRNLLPELFLDRPLRHFPSLWSSFSPSLLADFDEDLLPTADGFSTRGARIYEENDKLHVELPLAGLDLKDIEVSLNKGVLVVKGESKQEEKDKQRKFYRSSKRNYSYSLLLPTQIDEKQEPQATYTDGILTVALQLSKQAESKKITVKAGNNKK